MYQQYREGWLEVITGCMFAGKTEELIRRINVLQFAGKKVVVFKPKIDDRYSKDQVVSHCGKCIESFAVSSSKEILKLAGDAEVIAIDEVQFFDEGIIEVCNSFADQGRRVMAAGLDLDFRGKPFGVMPSLMTYAEFVTKLTAVCMRCGAPATRTQRLVDGHPARYDDPIIQVGASESYEARCRHCHEVPGRTLIK